MQERLRIEWFWKHLAAAQRRFWRPYLKQVDDLTLQYMRLMDQRVLTLSEQIAFSDSANLIYDHGAEEYARRHGAVVKEEAEVGCCGLEVVEVVLSSSLDNVAAIQWIDASSVWLSVTATGRDPEFRSYPPGTRVPLYPGAIYYYKLVLSDGRISERKLAPVITGSLLNLVLTWK
jgi:hypothetical protein